MSARQGYIYILTNPSIRDGLVKIGATTKDPLERARELSAVSGVVVPYTLAYSKHVAFPFVVEAEIHNRLAHLRINDSREFFKLSIAAAINIVEEYHAIPPLATPWAELFATFPDDGSSRELTEEERESCADLAWELKYSRKLR